MNIIYTWKKVDVSSIAHCCLDQYVFSLDILFNAIRIFRKKVSFIFQFCLDKYNFGLDSFWHVRQCIHAK